jgi:hypothetical protein
MDFGLGYTLMTCKPGTAFRQHMYPPGINTGRDRYMAKTRTHTVESGRIRAFAKTVACASLSRG